MSDGWTLAIFAAAALLVADGVLRWMESRGWIYYRRTKPGRGAVRYHILEMSSVFDPGFGVVQEVLVQEEQNEDEAGDPFGSVDGHSRHEEPEG